MTRIQQQVRPFLDFDGDNPATMVNNLDWTAPMSALDFLRDIGKHFRVNTMIRKDAVAARLASDDGISYTEFSYQILQGLDYLHLFREYGCTLQTGRHRPVGQPDRPGSDLIHRVEGAVGARADHPADHQGRRHQVRQDRGRHGLAGPADLMSPYAFYQFWVNVEDASVIDYLKVFTGPDPRGDRRAGAAGAPSEPFRRAAQRALAADVTTLVHGEAATAAVQAASEALFGKGDLHALDARTLHDATAELPGATVPAGTPLVEALVASGLVESRNAARRVLGEGGVSVNNVKVSDLEALLTEQDFLHGQVALLRRGRKSLAAARRAA